MGREGGEEGECNYWWWSELWLRGMEQDFSSLCFIMLYMVYIWVTPPSCWYCCCCCSPINRLESAHYINNYSCRSMMQVLQLISIVRSSRPAAHVTKNTIFTYLVILCRSKAHETRTLSKALRPSENLPLSHSNQRALLYECDLQTGRTGQWVDQ